MSKQLKLKKLTTPELAKKINEFRSYQEKRQEIKILQDHYDNSFTLKIEGQQ